MFSCKYEQWKNKITLEYGISSDGHMVSVLFSAETIGKSNIWSTLTVYVLIFLYFIDFMQ